MLMIPSLVKAPVVTYTETAKAHAWHNGNMMFDGQMGTATSSVGATGEVVLNEKYVGWLVVGMRYTRDNYNNSVKGDGARTMRLSVLESAWRIFRDCGIPYGEYASEVMFLDAPVIVPASRRFRAQFLNNFGPGSGAQWKEVEFIVGYP